MVKEEKMKSKQTTRWSWTFQSTQLHRIKGNRIFLQIVTCSCLAHLTRIRDSGLPSRVLPDQVVSSQRSYPHLFSWTVGSYLKNRISNTRMTWALQSCWSHSRGRAAAPARRGANQDGSCMWLRCLLTEVFRTHLTQRKFQGRTRTEWRVTGNAFQVTGEKKVWAATLITWTLVSRSSWMDKMDKTTLLTWQIE